MDSTTAGSRAPRDVSPSGDRQQSPAPPPSEGGPEQPGPEEPRRVEHALCPACGSADTSRLPTPQGRRSHRCQPCGRAFEPRLCPYCGSPRIEGSLGVAGALYKQPAANVRCTQCQAALPVLHEPYGQG